MNKYLFFISQIYTYKLHFGHKVDSRLVNWQDYFAPITNLSQLFHLLIARN